MQVTHGNGISCLHLMLMKRTQQKKAKKALKITTTAGFFFHYCRRGGWAWRGGAAGVLLTAWRGGSRRRPSALRLSRVVVGLQEMGLSRSLWERLVSSSRHGAVEVDAVSPKVK
ncbi:hypothetical protein TorRG33x02_285800 [Trema orientale]|uniref:Uncharacterized protein n=1 Tax=Trema orientale TaxID=63057 RepID=A0A2P5CGC8_TREOI|nr:hypothetical protein TorRG33x02_285800 [Trema orientale]